jgi:hypothetical protein
MIPGVGRLSNRLKKGTDHPSLPDYYSMNLEYCAAPPRVKTLIYQIVGSCLHLSANDCVCYIILLKRQDIRVRPR